MKWSIDITEAPCRAQANATLAPVKARVIVFDTLPESVETEVRANGPAKVSLASGPPGAVLSGTLIRDLVDGWVEFDDLSVDQDGDVRFLVEMLPALESYAGVVLGLEPVGYWKFDEEFGTTALDEVEGREAIHAATVLSGQPPLIGGSSYSARYSDNPPDPTIQRTRIPTNILPDSGATGAFTVCFWYASESQDQQVVWDKLNQGVVANNRAFIALNRDHLTQNAPGKICILTRNSGDIAKNFAFTEPIPEVYDGAPHFVVAVVDGASSRIYFDGNSVPCSGEVSTGQLHSHQGHSIGNSISGGSHFSGLLDEIAVFRKALSPEDVLRLYQARNDTGEVPGSGSFSFTPRILIGGPPDPVPTILPIVAVPAGDTLRIWCTAEIDPGEGAPTSPSSYTISAPDGPLSVVSASVDPGGLSVLLTLSRDVPDEDCTLTIEAGALVSVDGAESEETELLFRGAAPGPAPEPPDPPVVTAWSPEIGSTIGRHDEIAFSVLSESELATVIVWVRFDDIRQAALAFDGQTFRDHFAGSVEPIEGGRRYTLRRMTGWLSPPTVVVHATTCDGEETLYVHH